MQSPVTGPGPPVAIAKLVSQETEAIRHAALLAGAKVFPDVTKGSLFYAGRMTSGSYSAQVVPSGKEEGILSPVSSSFEGDLPIIPKLALPRLAKSASLIRTHSADKDRQKTVRRAPQYPVRIAPHPAGLAKLLGIEKPSEVEEVSVVEKEESSIADGTVPTMKLCEVCKGSPAVVFCAADQACLCHNCDTEIHSANALSSRHERISLLGVKDSPLSEEQAETGALSVGHTVTLSSTSKNSSVKRARTQIVTSPSRLPEDIVTSPSATNAQEVPSG
jgi:hypothetical protein